MASGKDAARDVRHGRRGGGWIPAGASLATRESWPACPVCGGGMAVGQTAGHAVCLGSVEAARIR